MKQRKLDLSTAEVDGIDFSDAPKFCDAFVAYCEWDDGTPLTEEELEREFYLNHELVHELVLERIY